MKIDVGSVLRRLRVEVKHLTLHELSDAINNVISPSALSRMEVENRSLSPEHLKILADYHRTTVADIFREAEGGAPVDPTISGARRVPLLEWSDVDTWLNPEKREGLRGTRETLIALPPVGAAAFGLLQSGDSMQNDSGFCFPDGVTILVEPDEQPGDREFVVALPPSGNPVCRQLVIEGADTYLKPLNRNYRPQLLEPGTRIAGAVRQAFWRS